MEPGTTRRRLRTPGGIVLAYASFAALWIAGSDSLLSFLFRDPDQFARISTLKGMLFIAVTSTLLYLLLRRWHHSLSKVLDTSNHYRQRLERVLKGSNDGWWDWDLKSGSIFYSPRCWEMLGYAPDELSAETGLWRRLMHPDDVAQAERHFREALEEGRQSCSIEARLRNKDGHYVPVLARFLIQRDADGVPLRISGTNMDLTERKQAEAERQARLAADAANRAKSDFLANMSHELRTPLNAILGYAQLLQKEKTLSERQTAGLSAIRQSGEHLLTLINDILDFAKVETGKLALNPTDIQLVEFLRTISEMISVKANQKGLDFISDIAPDLPNRIRVDERRLRQILLNLLSNAVKFADRGQVILRVRFLPPARLRFAVQDTGTGIAEDQLKAIFQPFEQVGEMQRRLGGAGLGLAISRQLVQLMGSDIQVESRVGQGSTFSFELDVPLVEGELAPQPLESVVTGYHGPRKKILVVDDAAENRAMVVDMLGPLGFEVAEAENGCDALEKVQTLRPHLILMDSVMPEMDGLEATRRLHQLPDFREVPIIAISASASGDDEQDSLAAGANAFLPKPIDLGRLLAQIATLLALDWIYELPQVRPAPEPEALGPLPALPEEEMEILHRLALLGNMQDILQRANYLSALDERYRPFTDRLCMLAKGYQSQAILNLVERHLEAGQAS
jgi:PAS domain S-box-containing protein